MFVDKYYDNSLWHIVNADKHHRSEIVEFIKSIPTELVDEIRESIIEYRHRSDDSFCDSIVFNNSQVVGDREIYSYRITFNGDLILKKSVKKSIYYEDVIELTLCELPDIKDMDMFDDEYLGSLETNISCEYRSEKICLTSCDESEYYMFKLPIGAFYFYCDEDKDNRKLRVSFSNIKSIPSNLEIDDLEKIVNKKSLVLRK